MDAQTRILIADDHPIFREGLVKTIERDKTFTVIGQAGDGAEALKLITELRPDLAVLDVSMPVMNGFEAFGRIRANYFTKDIPIVMLTAINEVEPGFGYNEEKMEKFLGVQRPEGFVDKPVNSIFLLNTVFGVVGDGRI